ncbi:MAG: DUF4870 domain-containing protein [Stenotrophomonas sp.]|uniref:DUF4870 domain-containing protein n=1 Tax=Stenotrophomonas sp. TaxID=69392 RepID=UPI003D6D3D3D
MSDYQNNPPPPPVGDASSEERQWAMFGHLSALTGVVTGGVGNIVGPLVIWLVKKDTMSFAADQAKEALNFNITLAIVALALVVLSVVTLGIGLIVVIPLSIALGVAWLVLTIMAGIKANEGVTYRYPFTLRLIK